jgi:hypothetical protein
MSADAFFPAAERALDAVRDDGDAPRRWTLTSSLYGCLDDTQGHWEHSRRAIEGREVPKPLYGVPVSIEAGAHHAWTLRTSGGATWTASGLIDDASR